MPEVSIIFESDRYPSANGISATVNPRAMQRAFRFKPRKCMYLAFSLLDRVDERARHHLAGHFARRDHAQKLNGRQAVKRRSHRVFQRLSMSDRNLAQACLKLRCRGGKKKMPQAALERGRRQ